MVSTQALSTNTQKLLNDWAAFCREQSTLHEMSWTMFRKLNLSTMIPAMLLSSISGISVIGFGNGNDACNTDSTTLIALGACSITAGALLAINKFLNYSELQQQHDMYCDGYLMLFNEILLQVAINNTSDSVFKNKTEFTKHCKNRLDMMIDKAPAIPKTVKKRLQKMGVDNCSPKRMDNTMDLTTTSDEPTLRCIMMVGDEDCDDHNSGMRTSVTRQPTPPAQLAYSFVMSERTNSGGGSRQLHPARSAPMVIPPLVPRARSPCIREEGTHQRKRHCRSVSATSNTHRHRRVRQEGSADGAVVAVATSRQPLHLHAVEQRSRSTAGKNKTQRRQSDTDSGNNIGVQQQDAMFSEGRRSHSSQL